MFVVVSTSDLYITDTKRRRTTRIIGHYVSRDNAAHALYEEWALCYVHTPDRLIVWKDNTRDSDGNYADLSMKYRIKANDDLPYAIFKAFITESEEYKHYDDGTVFEEEFSMPGKRFL